MKILVVEDHAQSRESLQRLLERRGHDVVAVGSAEEAKGALAKAITLAPASFDMYVRNRVPWHRPEDHAHMLEGLRKAGWEDQATSVPEAQ